MPIGASRFIFHDPAHFAPSRFFKHCQSGNASMGRPKRPMLPLLLARIRPMDSSASEQASFWDYFEPFPGSCKGKNRERPMEVFNTVTIGCQRAKGASTSSRRKDDFAKACSYPSAKFLFLDPREEPVRKLFASWTARNLLRNWNFKP